MKCTDCRYCVEQDHGYSNYTVEGTTCDCLLDLNIDFPADRFYGEEESLNFAEECHSFEKGNPVEMDVDGLWAEYDLDCLDDDIIELLKKQRYME